MSEIGNSFLNRIRTHRAEKRAQIYNSFNKSEDDLFAKAITKEDFESQYPKEKFEHYSLDSVSKFRQDIMKSEDIQNKDEAFKNATKDLKHFVVHNQGARHIVFVRQKEAGE